MYKMQFMTYFECRKNQRENLLKYQPRIINMNIEYTSQNVFRQVVVGIIIIIFSGLPVKNPHGNIPGLILREISSENHYFELTGRASCASPR